MNVLIVGGCGFIGSNAARRLLADGHTVTVLDNLDRPGARQTLAQLTGAPAALTFAQADVRDADAVADVVSGCAPALVLHLAGQVAVTASLADPRHDFDCNALGTLNVLEALRRRAPEAVLIYASTNKVYGPLSDLVVEEQPTRHVLRDRPHGVDESRPLDPQTPYGCSKACGDQYVLDYHRMFGLRTVCFRLSCVYGPRQLGVEAQGWVAWLVIAALLGRPITIFGDGKQVRDLLHVEDLVDAFGAAYEHIEACAGRPLNLGGGPRHTISVWAELGPLLGQLLGRVPEVGRAAWRPGDQRVYVSDIRRARSLLDWAPRIGVEDGLAGLVDWARGARPLLEQLP